MSKQFFHFTLGPVQTFVSQARRTRDLWAGSFLLSVLTGVAIKETLGQSTDNSILFPKPNKNFLDALAGKISIELPQQGNIPNRFKAEVSADFDPKKVTRAVQMAWQEITSNVLKQDLKYFKGWQDENQQIWDKQINFFWDMSWAITDDITDSSILDKRKNWRSHLQPVQYGTKCMIMAGYQELSAVSRPNAKKQKEFWHDLQKTIKSGKTDLRDGEMLCAISFVKRRFARNFSELNLTMPSGWKLTGWQVNYNVPSVQYMAAVHWIEQVLKSAKADNKVQVQVEQFFENAKSLIDRGETETKINCIEQQKERGIPPIENLDGGAFFSSVLENTQGAEKLQQSLNVLNKTTNVASSFYAILLMDGDSLGKHMSNQDSQNEISASLEKFTNKVDNIVKNNNGFLIYAGGDDVLALMPLEDALTCANELRLYYLYCFQSTKIPTTLSGAIEYVHIKTPLMTAIADAHPLLDDIAKDQTGRDSLAIRLQNPGNLTAQWSMPWAKVTDESGKIILESIASFIKENDKDTPNFSSKFIYSLRDKYAQFNFNGFSEQEIEDLILADYMQSSNSSTANLKNSRQLIQQLVSQMKPTFRVTDDKKTDSFKVDNQIKIDVGLIARFLAHKGVER